MTVIVIPVKKSDDVKSRLSGFLTPMERRELMAALFEDLGAAVARSRLRTRVLLVGGDPATQEAALNWGWDVREERRQYGESHSIDRTSQELEREGVRSVLRLPADLPLVRPKDIDRLLSQVPKSPGAVAVSNRLGEGTNALLRTPPTLFPSFFGPGSLEKHRSACRTSGAPFRVLDIPRIECDLDTAHDVLELVDRPPETAGRAWNYLKSLRLSQRTGM